MPFHVPLRRIDLPAGLLFPLGIITLPLLLLIGLQAYEAVHGPAQAALDRAWIDHTFDVIATSENMKAAAQNAERAQRGFLLTGTQAYLDRYRTEAGRSQELLESLRKLTVDNPEQQRRIPTLETALDEWLAEQQVAVDVYGRDGAAAAQELLRARGGHDTLRAVAGLTDASVEAERELLAAREARAAEHAARARQVAVASSIIGAALLLIGVWLIGLAFRSARRAEHERRQMEQQLNEQLLQAQAALAQTQKMEALGQLTGGVAHDFNNLLHVIKNAVTLAQNRVRVEDQDVHQYLAMAQRNADRAASTTARLLAFSRQQPLDPTPTDMNKLVAGMHDLLRHLLGESIAVEAVLGSGLWSVSIDKNQLETAVINLAVNARDAMPSSGKLTIETSNGYLDEAYAHTHPEVTAGQYAMIAVSDSGIGMTKEVATRAFDPFFTTKDAGRGTGLGLSQVFGFVKQSGGHIKIYSELGHGTTVKMYFPRLAGGEIEEPRGTPITVGAGSGETILVVEDNEDVRMFTERVLRDLGYRVSAAPDCRRALQLLEQLDGVDLLFTDVGLPEGLSGRELANEARRRWPQMKVLYTTGYARNSIIHHGRLDPGVELIPKPFTQAGLAEKVRRVLGETARVT
jgi:signal transduction histidine kinase